MSSSGGSRGATFPQTSVVPIEIEAEIKVLKKQDNALHFVQSQVLRTGFLPGLYYGLQYCIVNAAACQNTVRSATKFMLLRNRNCDRKKFIRKVTVYIIINGTFCDFQMLRYGR